MRCFFCDNIGGENTMVQLSEREERHLFNTLRGRMGDTVQLLDGKGVIAMARVAEGKKLLVIGKRIEMEPSRKIHLFVSPPRHNRMDQLLTECCEIGVWSITFMITEHAVVRPEEGSVPEKWILHLVEGCKQSRNPFMPELRKVIPFQIMLDEVKAIGCPAYFGSLTDAGKEENTVGDMPEAAWIVGPEGGFSPGEEQKMESAGFKPLKIGKWVMRIETAAVAGAVLLMNRGGKC